MAKLKYRYNPETLNIEKVKPGYKDYLKTLAGYLFVIALISIVAIFVFDTFIENPKVKALNKENEFMKQQLSIIQSELDTLGTFAGDLQKKDDDIYRNIFGVEQYPGHLRKGGIGGSDRYKNIRGYSSSEDIVETRKKISKLQRKFVAQSKSLEEVYDLAKKKTEMLSSIPAIQPVSNKDLTRMASGYGYRIHPIYKIRKLHTGMDFTAPTGTDIYATGDGVVVKIEKKRSGYGRSVVIKHGYGYQTLYGHMSKILVKRGQKIKRGEVIGLVGNTGTSVGPHLHYEVIKDGKKVNPASYYFNDLSPEQYEELLEKTQTSNQSMD